MAHSISLTATVGKIVRSQPSEDSFWETVFHATSCEKGQALWFTIKAQGKLAHACSDVERGDRVTVFGKISEQSAPIPGAIYIHASVIEVHGVDQEPETAL